MKENINMISIIDMSQSIRKVFNFPKSDRSLSLFIIF